MALRAAFDTETFLIEPGLQAPPMVCLTSKVEGSPAQILHARPGCMTWGARLSGGWYQESPGAAPHVARLLAANDRIYGVNLAFDAAVVISAFPGLLAPVFDAYDKGKMLDISIHEMLIDIGSGTFERNRNLKGRYSLAGMTERYLNKDRSAEKSDPDAWRLRYSELWDLDLHLWPEEAVEYALVDAVDPIAIAGLQEAKYGSGLDDSPRQARAAFCLHLMRCWGVKTNPRQIDRLEEVALEAYERLRDELVGLRFLRDGVNPETGRPWTAAQRGTMDTRRVQRAMIDACERAEIDVKLTDKGKEIYKGDFATVEQIRRDSTHAAYVRTDLEACEDAQDDGLMVVAQYKKANKLANTEVPDLRRGVVLPIQPAYNVLVASGRTSCRKGVSAAKAKPGEKLLSYGYQVQNPLKGLPWFPEGVGTRECFEAREGSYFIDNDVTGLELATVSEACLSLVGDSQMGELINSGIDPHLWFGAKLAGCTYKEAVEDRHTPRMKKFRSMAKPANFGLPGGMGAKGFRAFARGYGVLLTIDEAKDLIREWKEAFPEFDEYFRWINSHMDDDGQGVIEQLFVHRFRKTYYTSACNTMFQGLGADVVKHAMWLVTKACYVEGADQYLFGVRPWGFIHDEILAETTSRDPWKAHQQAFALARVMETGCNHYLRRVPISVEPALSLRFCKAESVFDDDGCLVPWDVARADRSQVFYADGKPVIWEEAA